MYFLCIFFVMTASLLGADVSIVELRKQIADMKYELNALRVDVQIHDEKLISQGDLLNRLNDSAQKTASQAPSFQSSMKELQAITQMQDRLAEDIRKLNSSATSTNALFGQYKTKLEELEKESSRQKQRLDQVIESLETLAGLLKAKNKIAVKSTNSTHSPATPSTGDPKNGGPYTVQAGDSLKKIANAHNVTVDAIKSANQLKSDLIVVGQELQIPK